MWVQSLGQEDPLKNPLEKEMATHSSIVAWEIPWTEESGGLPWEIPRTEESGGLPWGLKELDTTERLSVL